MGVYVGVCFGGWGLRTRHTVNIFFHTKRNSQIFLPRRKILNSQKKWGCKVLFNTGVWDMPILGDKRADGGRKGKFQIDGEKMAGRKEKNGEKNPWGQRLTRPVPNGRGRSGLWYALCMTWSRDQLSVNTKTGHFWKILSGQAAREYFRFSLTWESRNKNGNLLIQKV